MSKIYLTRQQKEWLKEAAKEAIAKKRAEAEQNKGDDTPTIEQSE